MASGPAAGAWEPASVQSVYGVGITEHLLSGIKTYLNTYTNAHTVALGCSPWITDGRLVDELLRFGSSCIVVDKQTTGRHVRRLLKSGPGIHVDQIGYSRHRAPGPSSWEELGDGGDIASVRAVGWRDGSKRLMHAKVLLLGRMVLARFDHEYGTDEQWSFEPALAWVGSANLTQNAGGSVEFGMWLQGDAVRDVRAFLASLISESEPFGATTTTPTPELTELPEPDFEELADYAAYLDEMRAFDVEAHNEPDT